MTTHTDTEALIAEARRLIAHTRTYNFGMWSADKLAHKVAGELADALESTLAELRQALHDLEIVKEADWSRGIAAEARADELRIELRRERERADDLYAANVGLVDAAYATDTALSRAEETIEKVRAEADAYGRQPDVMEPCGAVAQSLHFILTEYDKQKEVDRD